MSLLSVAQTANPEDIRTASLFIAVFCLTLFVLFHLFFGLSERKRDRLLNDKWQVVWYAGFRPQQLERVATKLRTQYYRYPYYQKRNIVKCPFRVRTFAAAHFGFAQEIKDDRAQGRQLI